MRGGAILGVSPNHVSGILCLLLADVVRVSWVERPLCVLEDAVLVLNAESLVLLLVQPDEELTRVDGGLAAAPLNEVLEALGILQDGADGAQAESLEAWLTDLGEVEQNVDALDVEEVELGSLIAKHGVRQAVDH